VLFIGGELDNIASAQMSQAVASQVPGAIYLQVKGGSHYMHYDNHRLMREVITDFLRDRSAFSFQHGLVTIERPSVSASLLTA
jgi:pimeloyl-ACP methyl ester carboxylesterase